MLDERFDIDRYQCHLAPKFGVFVDVDYDKLTKLNLISKLHKKTIQIRYIANSLTFCALLLSCLYFLLFASPRMFPLAFVILLHNGP